MKIHSLKMREANTLADNASSQEATPEIGDEFGFRGEVSAFMKKYLNLFRRHMTGTQSNNKDSADKAVANIKIFTKFTGRPVWLWNSNDLPTFLEHKCNTVKGGLAHSTQAGYITSLRTFQKYLFGDKGLLNEIHQQFGVQLQEWVNYTNSVVIKGKHSKRKKLSQALSDAEFEKLIQEFDDQINLAFESNSKARFPLFRDKVMTIVGYTYALRVSELANLHTWNFMPDKRYPQFKDFAMIDIIGKGSIEGSVHALDPAIAEVMDVYMTYIRPEFQDEHTEDPDLIFYSQQGGAMTGEQFRRRLANVGKSAGISKRVHPHILRRTNVTDSMELLGPVGTQKNVRHKNVATTYQDYYRPDPNEQGRAVANAIGKVTEARTQKRKKDTE